MKAGINPLPFPQIITGAVCGSWWMGKIDTNNTPYAFQQDGTPKGYLNIKFKDNTYSEEYIPFFDEEKISVSFTNDEKYCKTNNFNLFDATKIKTIINIYSNVNDSDIKIFLDSNELKMEKTENVPFSYSKEFLNYIPIFYIPKKSTHIWSVDMPGNLKPGDHVIRIEFTDRYGKLYSNERKFSIIQESAQ